MTVRQFSFGMVEAAVRPVRAACLIGACLIGTAATAQVATTPAQLRTYSTQYSIGVEWDLSGDTNHNAVSAVQFREAGATRWHDALDLMRIDYQGQFSGGSGSPQNMLSGSILFLMPDTEYEVQLTLTDPDGGSTTQARTVRTRALPKMPVGGRTLYVAPGSGGGTGTQADPLRGIAAANAVAQPGDVFLLGAGNYGTASITQSGQASNRIVWKAAGDGDAVVEGLTMNAAHVWLDGLTFQYNPNNAITEQIGPDLYRTYGLWNTAGRQNVVLTNNAFTGFSYSVRLHGNSDNWFITDNTIVGDKTHVYPPGEAPGQFTGEGIELNKSSGHVVAFNSISRTSDAISYPERNVDIFGNDIFEVSDDGVETDYGYGNNRVWGNRLHDVSNYVFSFQPQYGGPWYFIRNQATGLGWAYKFAGTVDRFVSVNNTFVNDGTVAITMQNILHSLSRNNLYISADGAREVWRTGRWNAAAETIQPPYLPMWHTDVDYDGFDWGPTGVAIRWDDVNYSSLAAFAAAIGIEEHAIRVDKNQIFIDFAAGNSLGGYLALKAGANAIDAGAPLANISDGFLGAAPDLGAHEFGAPLAHYGPRDAQQMREFQYYWSNFYADPLAGRWRWDLDVVASSGTVTGGYAIPQPLAAFASGELAPDLARMSDGDDPAAQPNDAVTAAMEAEMIGGENIYTIRVPDFLGDLSQKIVTLELAFVSVTDTTPVTPQVELTGFSGSQSFDAMLLDSTRTMNFSGGLWGGVQVYELLFEAHPEWMLFEIALEAGVFLDRVAIDTLSIPGTLGLLRGDFNLDGRLTNSDIQAMLDALTDLSAYQSAHGLSDDDLRRIGDVNGDGVVSNTDIQAMLNLLTGQDLANPVPEPGSLIWLTPIIAASRRRSPSAAAASRGRGVLRTGTETPSAFSTKE